MILRTEGTQNVEIMSVSRSLNKLIQIRVYSSNDLLNVKFGGKITTVCTRYYADYSFDYSKEIELWYNGKRRDLVFNDCHFSFHVKGYEKNTRNTEYVHSLTLTGCWPNGEEFTFDILLPKENEELVYVAYAIIILGETKNIEKAQNIWKIIRKTPYVGNAADRLQLVIEGENFAKSILRKHHFMTQVLKSGLQYHLQIVQEELGKLDFLKTDMPEEPSVFQTSLPEKEMEELINEIVDKLYDTYMDNKYFEDNLLKVEELQKAFLNVLLSIRDNHHNIDVHTLADVIHNVLKDEYLQDIYEVFPKVDLIAFLTNSNIEKDESI